MHPTFLLQWLQLWYINYWSPFICLFIIMWYCIIFLLEIFFPFCKSKMLFLLCLYQFSWFVCFILTMYHHFSWTLFRQFVLVNVIVRFGNFPLSIITENAFRALTLFLFCFFICHRFIQGPYQKTIWITQEHKNG